MATRRMGLKGDSSHMALVALNRKISLPLLTTTNVCRRPTAKIAPKVQTQIQK